MPLEDASKKKRLPTPCGTNHPSRVLQILRLLLCKVLPVGEREFQQLWLIQAAKEGGKNLLWELSHLDWSFCRCTPQRHSSASGSTCASPLAPPPPPPDPAPLPPPPPAPAPVPLIGCSQVRWLRTHHSSAEASGSLWLPGKNIHIWKRSKRPPGKYLSIKMYLILFCTAKVQKFFGCERFWKRMMWWGHHGDLVIIPLDYLLSKWALPPLQWFILIELFSEVGKVLETSVFYLYSTICLGSLRAPTSIWRPSGPAWLCPSGAQAAWPMQNSDWISRSCAFEKKIKFWRVFFAI